MSEVTHNKKLPAYWKEIYGWLYNSWWDKFLDNDLVQNILSFGVRPELCKSLLREVNQGERVLQLGITYGSQIEQVAQTVGFSGQFDVVDVSASQLKKVREKYKNKYPQLNFIRQNASQPLRFRGYDTIICFNLLHEVPEREKSKIVNNVLNSIREGGSAVFIDYHNPKKWNPLRWFLKSFNRLYEPFAEKIWENEIYSYSDGRKNYKWHKVVYGYGLYQKAVVMRKKPIYLA